MHARTLVRIHYTGSPMQMTGPTARTPRLIVLVMVAGLPLAGGCARPDGRLPATAALAAPASAPGSTPAPPAAATAATAGAASATAGCLPGHDGYLRLRLRGAIDRDIDWPDAQLQCEGGPRPQHRGGRIAFAGPVQAGHRLRLVFGLTGLAAGHDAHNLPTNVTVIVEGAAQLYATLGDGKCSTAELTQRPLPTAAGAHRYRITARGFCLEPATAASGGRLLISRFDFAGPIDYEDNE